MIKNTKKCWENDEKNDEKKDADEKRVSKSFFRMAVLKKKKSRDPISNFTSFFISIFFFIVFQHRFYFSSIKYIFKTHISIIHNKYTINIQ